MTGAVRPGHMALRWLRASLTGGAARQGTPIALSAETVTFCLSKGPGAPVGSVLGGSRATCGHAPAGRHRSVCIRQFATHFVSAPEQLSMASDPDLRRFAGSSDPRFEDGHSYTALQWRHVDNAFPWQHPNKVLHFVCEFRESSPRLPPPSVIAGKQA